MSGVAHSPSPQGDINPTSTELRTKSKLNLLVAGTEDAIVMVESGAQEISEAEMVQALTEGHAAIKQIVGLLKDLRAKAGKPKWSVKKKEYDPSWVADAERAMAEPLLAAMRHPGKIESYALMKKVKDDYLATIPETETEKRAAVPALYDALREKIMRWEILENSKRPDGRRFDQIRHIHSEVGVLPRTHGSALFTRGETQALVTVTSAPPRTCRSSTRCRARPQKRFMLHYNFPVLGGGCSLRGPGRREIGHGRSPSARAADMLPTRKGSRTRSASSRTSSSRTARPRWPRSAAARWR